MDVERIGDPGKARKPSPLLVNLNSQNYVTRYVLMQKKLKGKDSCDKIYVKEDAHPAIRAENTQIYKLVRNEREKYVNMNFIKFF